MKIPINLASQPFRRDRPMIAASLAVSAFLVVTLAFFTYLALVDRSQLAGVRHDIARLRSQISTVNAQQAQFDAILHKPENATVLETSVFLNYLIYHKAISWSHIFADLETTLPYNVKVISLRPSINAQNQVVLDIYAGAESDGAIIGFLKSLESSNVFSGLYSRNIQPPTQAEPLWRCHVTVKYAQKL